MIIQVIDEEGFMGRVELIERLIGNDDLIMRSGDKSGISEAGIEEIIGSFHSKDLFWIRIGKIAGVDRIAGDHNRAVCIITGEADNIAVIDNRRFDKLVSIM